jgi:putative Mg2+ transporter-C (MgtC) family protein
MWSWLVSDWRVLLPLSWAHIGLAVVAVTCGAIVGGERERREKPAGLRTMILVCLGAAVFTMIGFVFSSTTRDSGRVAAQIVTGIGFLGAGVILHSRGNIIGVTTAATIWVMAAIGITVGAGYAGAGLGVSLLARLVLSFVYYLESRFLGGLWGFSVHLLFKPEGGKTRVQIEKILSDFNVDDGTGEFTTEAKDMDRLHIALRLPPRQRHELLAHLATLPEVTAIRVQLLEQKSNGT